MKPDQELEFITNAIHGHGIPFKKAMANEFATCQPAPSVMEEFPTRFGEPTAIDLLVRFKVPRELTFIVECKRVYPTERRWIFFNQLTSRKVKYRYQLYSSGAEAAASTDVNFLSSDIPICSDGMQIDLKKPDLFKAGSPDEIYNAAKQVTRGLLGYSQEEVSMRKRSPLPYEYKEPIYSLVVTTAPLYVCDVDPEMISRDTVNFKNPPNLQPCDWLLLIFPASPTSLQLGDDFRVPNISRIDPATRQYRFKEPIYVVASSKVQEFVKLVNSW